MTGNKFPLIDKPAIIYVVTNKTNGKRYIGDEA